MTESEEFIFNKNYCERVKQFRKETNMTAEEMATILDVPAERYRKYETRGPMPTYLVPKFCRIVGCDLEHLILGKARQKTAPVIVARKSAIDIAERVDALSNAHQQAAIKVADTSAALSGMNQKADTPSN